MGYFSGEHLERQNSEEFYLACQAANVNYIIWIYPFSFPQIFGGLIAGFGLWVLSDKQSFIAVLRKCYAPNTFLPGPSMITLLSANTHHYFSLAVLGAVKWS